ncbi:major capsid protein [Phocoenobacter skyensis]|uniref:Major capsid protein n=1 Tax=Phocoenobacter skyensis TaxID=97481 RepID=A0ABT9JIC7_9PAST|nr:major capsid protein [Pasteurella skyensis]MDP8078342.1 major capsid protein [Pasteurella skyensis]MDP8084566.1 major capsid protein [Pasteurella skyensis]
MTREITRLTNAVIPEVYATYGTVDDMTKTAFYQSGVIKQNDILDKYAKEGGHSIVLPFWNDLDVNDEPEISSDDPKKLAEPGKMTSGKMIAYKTHLNKPFGAADLVGEIAGSEPMARIRSRFGAYWGKQLQKRLIKTAQGIYTSNIAKNDGDMIYDISVDNATNITSENLFSVTAFTGATFTLGDAFETLGAIAMHSMVYKRLVDKNEVETVRATDGTILYKSYKGLRIILDDSMPVIPISGGSGFKFISVIFGAGAIGYGKGKPKTPVEVVRNALAGNGGGTEVIIERKTLIIHPFGYKATEGESENGHSLSELQSADTWERVLDRKHIPMAFLITNG